MTASPDGSRCLRMRVRARTYPHRGVIVGYTMQPTTSFDWGRMVTPARWIATTLGGVALIGWAATLDVIQWVVWAAASIDFVIAILRRGIGELGGGLVLVGAAAAMGVVSGFQGPALLAVPLFAIAGALFAACGQYTLARQPRHTPGAMA